MSKEFKPEEFISDWFDRPRSKCRRNRRGWASDVYAINKKHITEHGVKEIQEEFNVTHELEKVRLYSGWAYYGKLTWRNKRLRYVKRWFVNTRNYTRKPRKKYITECWILVIEENTK